MSLLLVPVALLFILVAAIWWFMTKNHSYWEKKGIPHLKSTGIFGNLRDRFLFRVSGMDFDIDTYNKFPNEKYFGYYELRHPVLWIRDPDLIRHIAVKDFDHFVDRRKLTTNNKYFEEALGNRSGQEWKDHRYIVSPAFTSGKLKRTFNCITRAGNELNEYLSTRTGQDLEMRDLFGRFTMDVISASAFAVDCQAFKDPNATFSRMAARIFQPKGWRIIPFVVLMVCPELADYYPFPFMDEEAVNFFVDVAMKTVEYRRREGVEGNDFLQLLMDAQKEDEEERRRPGRNKAELSDLHVAANSLMFFAAGYETTALTLTFMSYHLAVNQDVQETLIQEVDDVLRKYNGEITYEAVHEMHYLEMAVDETLRIHTPAVRLERICAEPYTIPGSDHTIEKGTIVVVPAAGIHMDEKYYPNPRRFDPSRFTAEEKTKRHPYVYLPFGSGPRNCIGMRFALLEAKVAIASLLREYRIVPCKKTQIPMEYDPTQIVSKAKGGTWLHVQKRSQTADH